MSLVEVAVRAKRFAGAAAPATIAGEGGVEASGGRRGTAVLTDVRFGLAAGEVLGVVGASGCGKSTLLRIVAGLDPDFEGEVRLDGRLRRGPDRDIGVVFQEPRLFPWLTVAENVGFDLGQGHDEAWVRTLLDEVGLGEFEDALPRQLSGGQAQRAAIARALYTRPRVLLLDEPFSALDAFTRMRLQDLVREVARSHGTSLLLVTHDIEEAVLLADRVLVLGSSPGRIVREIEVTLHHPRGRGSAEVAALRGQVLSELERVA
ncbi:MAG: ABC transporter ATP-binding protein [Mitsuaria chitosanitabida]|uniref:ABC transporter ATP-binding protein n=1 Tax=Roseateles chitosanitabidus TaxID=65048 RepID=UPI001B20F6C3|nr:ABC transporter ATP-binding protein [Roseateles chitosanitabidus]MBO9685480.1 ABC transporter ATP-binding protein [Roseateles chitosanitabidus]